MEYYSVIKKREGNLAICNNMNECEGIMLSETGQTDNKYRMISLKKTKNKKDRYREQTGSLYIIYHYFTAQS